MFNTATRILINRTAHRGKRRIAEIEKEVYLLNDQFSRLFEETHKGGIDNFWTLNRIFVRTQELICEAQNIQTSEISVKWS